MIYRILFIVCVIIFNSCKKPGEKNEESNYIFTGVVVDQVTKQIVAGASVSLGYLLLCDPIYELKNFGSIAISGSDGKFKIIVPKTTYDLNIKGACTYIHAWKDGFIGSSQVFIEDFSPTHDPSPTLGEIGNIELYHYGQLNLHVKNDTINDNIDEVVIYFYKRLNWDGSPPAPGGKNCSGKDFDTVFFYNQLWGNQNYFISAYQYGYSFTSKYLFFDSVSIKPDTITYFSVSF